MRFGAINLQRVACALVLAATLGGAAGTAYAQGRYDTRKVEKRALKEHQKFERRELKERLRTERRLYGKSRDWRTQRQSARVALRQHQRAERLALRQRYNPGRHLGRGYYRAPGQRLYTGRRIYRSRFYR